MKAIHWHIRLGNETIGPISTQELRDLASQGTLTPETLVSIDGQKWHKASKVRGLKFGPVDQRSSTIPPSAGNMAMTTPVTWVLVAVGGILLSILVAKAMLHLNGGAAGPAIS